MIKFFMFLSLFSAWTTSVLATTPQKPNVTLVPATDQWPTENLQGLNILVIEKGCVTHDGQPTDCLVYVDGDSELIQSDDGRLSLLLKKQTENIEIPIELSLFAADPLMWSMSLDFVVKPDGPFSLPLLILAAIGTYDPTNGAFSRVFPETLGNQNPAKPHVLYAVPLLGFRTQELVPRKSS